MTASSTDSIVFFGDSLSDSGNLFAAADGIIDETVRQGLAGFGGRASNGLVYAEYVGALAGFGSTFNYAVAGGESAGTQPIFDFIVEGGFESAITVPLDDPRLDFDMNLDAQLDRFQDDFSGQDLSDTTGFVLVGGNDYAAIDLSNPLTVLFEAFGTLTSSVTATLGSVVELSVAGVGEVVISTLPNPAFFPSLASQGDTVIGLADILFDLHNGGLTEGVQFLSDLGLNVRLLEIQDMTQAILEDPTGFGLIAPLELTLQEGDPAVLASFDPDQVAFWDSIHPSAATHGILGAFVAEALHAAPTVLGAEADFTMTGSDDDLIIAMGGNDTVDGGAGEDTILGGSGDDGLLGGADADLILAGSGDDWVDAGDGDDVVQGGQGDDILMGGIGEDVLFDGLGSDTVLGDAGDDVFVFAQAELIGGITGTDTDFFLGGAGQDSLIVAVADQTLTLLNTLASDAERLQALGVTAGDIEDIQFVTGLGGLSSLSGNSWFESADLWGVL